MRVTERMRRRERTVRCRKAIESTIGGLYVLVAIGLILYVYVAGFIELGRLLGWW